MNSDDNAFIYSTISKQLYRSGANHYKFCQYRDYSDYVNDFISKILMDHDVKILVSDDAEFQILGYIVYSTSTSAIIYVYLKSIYRDKGLMSYMVKALFDDPPIFYCFLSTNKNFKNFVNKYALKYLPVEFLT